jgi:galactoside O-acetyltransferase
MNSGKCIMNPLEDTRPKPISGREGTTNLKLVKIFSQEVSAWIETLFRYVPGRIGAKVRQVYWGKRFLGSGNLRIGNDCTFVKPKAMRFSGLTMINDGCYFNADGGSITAGNWTAFNIGAHINASCGGNIILGDYCLIGPGVVMRTANHRFEKKEVNIRGQGHQIADIVIEDDCWIGANAVILSGVQFGRGAIIGAGAVVTRDIPSMAIAVGVPAKVLKYRGAQSTF